MLRIHPLDGGLVVTATTALLSLDAALERRIEEIWRQEQRKRATPLFNGELLSVVSLASARIETRAVEYRCFVAPRAVPSLFSQLKVRPLAVSGLTRCRAGIVFGRRAATSTQDAGLCELAPSGGVDRRALRPNGRVDVIGQLMEELREETGCSSAAVTSAKPFLLVEDTASGVIDIGIDLVLDLDAASVLAAHRASAMAEYDELQVVPVSDLGRFVEDADPPVVEVSLALLRARGLLEGEADTKSARRSASERV